MFVVEVLSRVMYEAIQGIFSRIKGFVGGVGYLQGSKLRKAYAASPEFLSFNSLSVGNNIPLVVSFKYLCLDGEARSSSDLTFICLFASNSQGLAKAPFIANA
jgi:hypothetical protein